MISWLVLVVSLGASVIVVSTDESGPGRCVSRPTALLELYFSARIEAHFRPRWVPGHHHCIIIAAIRITAVQQQSMMKDRDRDKSSDEMIDYRTLTRSVDRGTST